jgi:hypothetical protein
MIKPGQCIELDSQFIIRISTIEPIAIIPAGGEHLQEGFMFNTYANRIRLFFEPDDLVDLVDESTLTQLPFD